MRAVLALDLDATMVYSARSAEPLDGAPTVWVEELDGAPLTMMTVAAHSRLEALSRRHHVVPVTTRTPEQLARIRLPGEPAWAIASNGGVLLHQGIRDVAWDAAVAQELAAVAPAREASARLEQVAGASWVRVVRQVEDLFAYLVAHDRDAIPAEWVEGLSQWASARGWTVSVQGRKAYLVPRPLSKGTAAARLAEALGGPLLAAGDSLLDRDLLEAAVVAVRPAHGELHQAGWSPAWLHVTASSGARAAEEILDLLGSVADGPQ